MLKTPDLFLNHSLFISNRIPISDSSIQIQNSVTNPNDLKIHRSNRIQIRTQQHKPPILFARRGTRKDRALSRITIRVLTNLVSLAASNIKFLPPPLDFVLEEFGGGDGTFGGGGRGGLGFWKGFFGWEGFDGRRRKKRKKSDLWMFGFAAAILVFGFLFWGEIERNAIWLGLGFGPLGIAVIRCLDRIDGVQFLVFLGFGLWSFVVGMSFRREELRSWISGVMVSKPIRVFGNLVKNNKKKNRKSFLRK